MKVLLLLLLLLVCAMANAAHFDRHLCKSCVLNGCSYCRIPEDYVGGDVCLCPNEDTLTFRGPLGTCRDYYVGAAELTSRPDCTFRSKDGEIMSGFVVVCLLLGLWILYGCISTMQARRQRKIQAICKQGEFEAARSVGFIGSLDASMFTVAFCVFILHLSDGAFKRL